MVSKKSKSMGEYIDYRGEQKSNNFYLGIFKNLDSFAANNLNYYIQWRKNIKKAIKKL